MKYIYGKNAFITGASSGIGLATAELFAEKGYIVYAASRNPALEIRRFESGGEIRPIALDVRDKQSVDEAAEHVLAQTDIGIIVHCAGIGIACAGEDFADDAVMNLMDTNFTGVLRVNSRFLPHLRNRGCGLCIIVGSVGGIFPIPYQSHYCASKAALDLYTASLRMELRSFGVNVSLVMPGDTNTGFTGARKYEIEESSPFYDACVRAVGKMEKDELSGYPPITAAKAILKLSTMKNPPARKIIGFDYNMLALLRRLLPDRVVEFFLRKMYLG